jgi:hypothetical protein
MTIGTIIHLHLKAVEKEAQYIYYKLMHEIETKRN